MENYEKLIQRIDYNHKKDSFLERVVETRDLLFCMDIYQQVECYTIEIINNNKFSQWNRDHLKNYLKWSDYYEKHKKLDEGDLILERIQILEKELECILIDILNSWSLYMESVCLEDKSNLLAAYKNLAIFVQDFQKFKA